MKATIRGPICCFGLFALIPGAAQAESFVFSLSPLPYDSVSSTTQIGEQGMNGARAEAELRLAKRSGVGLFAAAHLFGVNAGQDGDPFLLASAGVRWTEYPGSRGDILQPYWAAAGAVGFGTFFVGSIGGPSFHGQGELGLRLAVADSFGVSLALRDEVITSASGTILNSIQLVVGLRFGGT